MSVAATIERKLRAAFDPIDLEIVDESHLHAGHAGAREEGESHFRLAITAAAFAGKSRVDAQRLVYGALSEELAGPVHALSVSTKANPD